MIKRNAGSPLCWPWFRVSDICIWASKTGNAVYDRRVCLHHLHPFHPAGIPVRAGRSVVLSAVRRASKATWNKLAAAEHERLMYEPEGFGAPWPPLSMPPMPDYPKDDVNPVLLGGSCIAAGVILLIITMFPDLWLLLSELNVGTVLVSLGLIGYGLHMLKRILKHRNGELGSWEDGRSEV